MHTHTHNSHTCMHTCIHMHTRAHAHMYSPRESVSGPPCWSIAFSLVCIKWLQLWTQRTIALVAFLPILPDNANAKMILKLLHLEVPQPRVGRLHSVFFTNKCFISFSVHFEKIFLLSDYLIQLQLLRLLFYLISNPIPSLSTSYSISSPTQCRLCSPWQ